MPGGSSLEAIPKVAETSPDTSVVVLTMQDDPAFAREALQAGARGYVLKHAAGTELVQAIPGRRRRRNLAQPGPRRAHGGRAGRPGRRAGGAERARSRSYA